jgi:hypothetical protein
VHSATQVDPKSYLLHPFTQRGALGKRASCQQLNKRQNESEGKFKPAQPMDLVNASVGNAVEWGTTPLPVTRNSLYMNMSNEYMYKST